MATLPNHMVKVRKEMAEQRKVEIKKRNRVNPTFRWSEGASLAFIMKVVERVKDSPESYEKPTAQRFYESLGVGCPRLKEIPWMCMKNKMRAFKVSYLEAKKWKQEKGAALIADGDEKSVIDYLQRKCPYYDKLHLIFRNLKSTNPGDPIHTSQLYEEFLNTDYDTPQSPITTPFPFFSPEAVSEVSSDSDRSLNVSREDSLTLLMAMQQEKLQLERDKFEWQKQKEQQELDNNFKIKQMELEQNERLKKFEIEMKYKNK